MSKQRVWIGIDPGASGALCIYKEDGEIALFDFAKGGIENYTSQLKSCIDLFQIEMIGLEKVHSMPGQGVKAMFSFGERYGELQGMLRALGLGYDLIRPQLWQKSCGIQPKSTKKDIAAVISRLYPSAELYSPQGGLKDGRADALGITHYLRKTYGIS